MREYNNASHVCVCQTVSKHLAGCIVQIGGLVTPHNVTSNRLKGQNVTFFKITENQQSFVDSERRIIGL